jgi:hypothetical protein
MKYAFIAAMAALTLLATADCASAATAKVAPNGYFYDASGKLVRMPGPGMMYDANGKMVPKTTGCGGATSSSSAASGGKTSVSFPSCTADGANVETTTTKSAASASSAPAN